MGAPLSEAAEIDAPPYDASRRLEHGLLLGASVLVVALAYHLRLLANWALKQQPGGRQIPAFRQARGAAAAVAVAAAAAGRGMRQAFGAAPGLSPPPGGDRPFRFRASDAERELNGNHQAPPPGGAGRLPATPAARRKGGEAAAEGQQQPGEAGWEPSLLAKCAGGSPYISSVEALQTSPLFRSHISGVRGRRLNYETAEDHKLRVYRALRDVDPEGFRRLFSRSDVLEYEEVPPPRWLAAAEALLSGGLTFALLALPWLLPALCGYRLAGALSWAALYLLASVGSGCTSPFALAVNVHPTAGEYSMLPAWHVMVAAVLLEAALVVGTAGLGVALSVGLRLGTGQRQSFSERVLRLVPLQELVRPMHFSALPPGAAARG